MAENKSNKIIPGIKYLALTGNGTNNSINLVSGNQHPPIPIMILTLIPVLVLFRAWKKAEI